MSGFVVRRVLQAIPTFLGITLLSFLVLHLAPGDPVSLMVVGAQNVTPDDLAAMRSAYGLAQPLPCQYLRWLQLVRSGDLGQSCHYRRPVLDLIPAALPNTLLLGALSLTTAVAIGVPLGVLAALHRGSLVDQANRIV